MNRTAMLREVRMEALERVYAPWRRKGLVQAQAAGLLKMSERTSRRWGLGTRRRVRPLCGSSAWGAQRPRAPPEEVTGAGRSSPR